MFYGRDGINTGGLWNNRMGHSREFISDAKCVVTQRFKMLNAYRGIIGGSIESKLSIMGYLKRLANFRRGKPYFTGNLYNEIVISIYFVSPFLFLILKSRSTAYCTFQSVTEQSTRAKVILCTKHEESSFLFNFESLFRGNQVRMFIKHMISSIWIWNLWTFNEIRMNNWQKIVLQK